MKTNDGIDKIITTAVTETVNEMKQPISVADRLNKWISDLSLGNTQLENTEDTKRWLEIILATVKAKSPGVNYDD